MRCPTACTPAELAHVEPATLLEEILRTGVQVASQWENVEQQEEHG
jgi:hypothetical protein